MAFERLLSSKRAELITSIMMVYQLSPHNLLKFPCMNCPLCCLAELLGGEHGSFSEGVGAKVVATHPRRQRHGPTRNASPGIFSTDSCNPGRCEHRLMPTGFHEHGLKRQVMTSESVVPPPYHAGLLQWSAAPRCAPQCPGRVLRRRGCFTHHCAGQRKR